MIQRTRRSQIIRLRLSPAEKTLIEERAATAGLKVSEYIRREAGIGHFGRADLRRGAEGRTPKHAEHVGITPGHSQATRPEQSDDLEARVRELTKTMPRRNAENLARRELARRKAAA